MPTQFVWTVNVHTALMGFQPCMLLTTMDTSQASLPGTPLQLGQLIRVEIPNAAVVSIQCVFASHLSSKTVTLSTYLCVDASGSFFSAAKVERENRNCMVDNPLYEGPIYEVISESKRLKLGAKDKVHAQESLYLDNPTQSLPRDIAPPYDGNGTIVRVSMADEGKQTEIKIQEAEMEAGESSLDHRKCGPKRGYENIALTPGTMEDPYTVMSPVGATAATYQVDCGQSNGETSSGRYVMDTSGHHQATLV